MAECEWVVLCDNAFADQNGKLCMIGVFDVITALEAPAIHDRASIAFSVIGEPGENVQMSVDIIGPLGQRVGTKATMAFTLPDQGAARGQVDVRMLTLPDFGRYAIQVDTGDGLPRTAWFTLQAKQG